MNRKRERDDDTDHRDDDTDQPPRKQQRAEQAACVRIGTQEVPLDTLELTLRKELTALPESIGELRALTKLDVYSNQLKELPAAIGSLTALTRLTVRDNPVTKLPAAIGSLTALTDLNVSYNQLTQLPAAIFSLARLKKLNVRRNQLTELPAEIGNLTALTELNVGQNQLTELPATTFSLTGAPQPGIDSLSALTKLDISDNCLTYRKLPTAIFSLTALTELDASLNQLTELPVAIGNLTALTKLDVGSNQLKELPATIGSLTALTMLNVACQRGPQGSHPNWRLKELPATIGSLTALTFLGLSLNELTELPAAIGNLRDNTKLDVVGNPLQLPPRAVAERGPAAIRAYFEDLEAGTAIARTCMLVLLGDAEMGKTSLLNGLLNDCVPNPAPAEQDGRTVYLEIKPLSLGAGESAVKFMCYNLGGQHKSYAAAQQAYVARGALFLLVVSAEAARSAAQEEQEERLRWWLHFLQTNAPGAVVQPVLTHVDKCTEAEAAERAGWVVGVCQKHLDRVNTLPGSPAPLSIQLGHVPRVNAAAGGGATLSAVRDRLHALACPPAGQSKLLPIVGQTIPKLWEPAMEFVRAVRSGADCTAAARTALLGPRPPSTVGVDSGGRPLLYELVATLQGKWGEVAAALVAALRDELGEEDDDDDEDEEDEDEDRAITQLRRRKAALSTPSHCRSILTSALQLMAFQGEIILSGDIAYLDPCAITSLIAPLVDHRLNDVHAYLSVGGPGENLLTHIHKSTPIANAQPKYEGMRAALKALAGPQALLDPDVLSFLWRDQKHHDLHSRMLCDAGLLLRLNNPDGPDKYIMPLRLETTAPPGLNVEWPATPRMDESHFRRVYEWNNAGFVPPGLCEKMAAAFQRVAGCCYVRDALGCALVWQRGALLKLGGATVKLEVAVVKEDDDLLLQLVADARGTDEGSLVRALLETGDVHTTLGSVLAGFPGLSLENVLSRMEISDISPLEAVVTRMEQRRMRNAVAVTVGNRHIGQVNAAGESRQLDSHLSAQDLEDALKGRGLRVEAPWIDQPGGAPMLERLRQVLASKVQPTDDGFVFCYSGHGVATELVGHDWASTSYQAIIDTIDCEPKLQGKSKLVVFDCCQLVASDWLWPTLYIPKNMIVARSTALGTCAWVDWSKGNRYSNRLADAIRCHAATRTLEDLLKLAQGEVHGLGTPAGTPQIAYVEAHALGAFHLYLGDA